jgi:hypothetical protein
MDKISQGRPTPISLSQLGVADTGVDHECRMKLAQRPDVKIE